MLVNSPARPARSVPPVLGVAAADALVATTVTPGTGVGAAAGELAGATGATRLQAASSNGAAPRVALTNVRRDRCGAFPLMAPREPLCAFRSSRSRRELEVVRLTLPRSEA